MEITRRDIETKTFQVFLGKRFGGFFCLTLGTGLTVGSSITMIMYKEWVTAGVMTALFLINFVAMLYIFAENKEEVLDLLENYKEIKE